MTHALRSAAVASITALAAVAALIAADLTPPASAQSEDETTGRIVARRLATGRVEFGWQPTGGARVLPQSRYFPADPGHNRWLRSSPVEVGGVELGRINARLRADGRIEFAFTPTDGERIAPQSRYFPADATVNRWLRSTEITFNSGPSPFIAVSAGNHHACAIRASGAIECWGGNSYGETGAPKGSYPTNERHTVSVVGTYGTVSAGNYHTCAIRSDGAITCWGYNEYGQTDAPAGRFTAVSAGSWHTCAIRESGKIKCWGNNGDGQSDAPAGSFTAVSAGALYTCAIRENKEIECWGYNEYGQANAPAGSFTAVSAGWSHTCGLRESGALECWGTNNYGERDAPAGRFTAVSAGGGFDTCAIRTSGALTCWGYDSNYNSTPGLDPTGRYTAVSNGSGHTCAIRTSDSEIVCWQRFFGGE